MNNSKFKIQNSQFAIRNLSFRAQRETPNNSLLPFSLLPSSLLLFSLLLLSCGNKTNSGLSITDIKNPATAEGVDPQQQKNMPEIMFDNLSYNFGKVIQGEMLSYTFHFTNVGKSNLIISSIDASCGCTTSSPPKAPVKQGEKGELSITFDSKYKSGEVASYLVVTTNTYPAQNVLTVLANVVIP